MLDSTLNTLFSTFNNKNIDYCLVRDFQDINSLNNSDDIDIMIRSSDSLRAINLLEELGWLTPTINPNTFGHIQYYKAHCKKVYKLDILNDLYFADGKYRFRFENEDILFTEYNNIRVPTDEYALLFLLLHILLDKNFISNKNANQLEELVSKSQLSNSWWYILAKGIVDTHDYKLKLKDKYLNEIERSGCVEKRDNSLWKLKRRLLGYIWSYKKEKNRFALLGVDGTGKSSTIGILKEYYDKDVFIQYMGFRSYTTKFAKKWAGYSAPRIYIPGFNLCLQQTSCYYEMLNRYYSAKKSQKKILLFDRYPWEAYDNARNMFVKMLSGLLFKVLFPKPDHIIYLYCPTNVSLERKNDIDDIDGFVKMKGHIDSVYMNKSSALVLDTSIDDQETVVDKVITYICVCTQGYVR